MLCLPKLKKAIIIHNMEDFITPDGIDACLNSAKAQFLAAVGRQGVVDPVGVVFVLWNGDTILSNNVASDASSEDGYDEITMVLDSMENPGSLRYVVVCHEEFNNSSDPVKAHEKYAAFKAALATHPAAGDDVRIYSCTPDYPKSLWVHREFL